MIPFTHPSPLHLLTATLFLGVAAFSGSVQAEMVSFSAVVGDETRIANTEQVEHDGVLYVSLSSVVRQFKGECSILSSRVQVDFNSRTAWLRVNGALVSSTHGEFVVGHPVLLVNEQVFMAVGDVTPFFTKAFRVSVNRNAAGVQPLVLEDPEFLKDLPQVAPSMPGDTAIQVIVIDPGHGGPDEGVVGKENILEKDITLAIALELGRVLEEVHGKTAVLTRDRDVQLPVGLELSRFSAQQHADLFVSIHTGAGLSDTVRGFELFCPSEAAILRAAAGLERGTAPITAVQGQLDRNQAIAQSVGAMLAEATDTPNRGIRHVGCRVLEGLPIPGFLIEVGFMTNPSEAVLLASESYQMEIAKAIAAGIAGVSEKADQ